MSKTETQSKALQLADACADDWHAVRSHLVVAELRRLHAENKQLNVALDEWLEKTHWVQETAQALELGMHRADVLRARIEALDAENKALRARLEEQAFVPPGFALVPVEPTKEMVAAACRDHGYPGGSRSAYVLGYRSMLAAAPQAAAKTGDAA